MSRSGLRESVRVRAGDRCEWPRCPEFGDELAHGHSIGMGGRASADTLDNVFWLCWDHARISDGEFGAGGKVEYDRAHRDLLGDDYSEGPGLAWSRAEALCRIVADKKGRL